MQIASALHSAPRALSWDGSGERGLKPAFNQNNSFNANWIWREVVDVAVITPAEEL